MIGAQDVKNDKGVGAWVPMTLAGPLIGAYRRQDPEGAQRPSSGVAGAKGQVFGGFECSEAGPRGVGGGPPVPWGWDAALSCQRRC